MSGDFNEALSACHLTDADSEAIQYLRLVIFLIEEWQQLHGRSPTPFELLEHLKQPGS